MMEPEQRAGSLRWLTFVAFAVVLTSEVIWYPELASFVSRDILTQGDAGYEILYYRDVYVLTGAAAFGIVVAAAAITTRHSRRRLRLVLWGACALDVLLLVISLWRYFTAMAAAERFRGI